MMPESGRTVFPHEAASRRLDFRLFGDIQRVIDLDAEVSDGTLELGMAQQYLDSPKVLRTLVDQRGLCSPHRVRAHRPLDRGRWTQPSGERFGRTAE